MTIIPYACMMNDPTTEVVVVWLDRRENPVAASQTLRYGPDNLEVHSNFVEVRGGFSENDIPVTCIRHYVHLTNLAPGSLCALSLPVEGITFPPVKMLPVRIPQAGITGMAISDTHVGKRTIDEPSKFDHIAAESPDFIIMPGDAVGEGDTLLRVANGEIWADAFTHYFSRWWDHRNFLPQILYCPGNHDVRNGNADGETLGSAILGTGMVDWMLPSMKLSQPAGERHVFVRAGNWLYVFGADVYSAIVADAKDRFEKYYDPEPGFGIFMAHSPMFSEGSRNSNDPIIQANMRNAFLRNLSERENMRMAVAGNIHLDYITKPLAWYPDNPGQPAVALDEGFAAPAPHGPFTITEFGEGCLGGRRLLSEPVVPKAIWDRTETRGLNYYLLHFTPGHVLVEDKNESGTAESREFRFPFLERNNGILARCYRSGGSPVYPHRLRD